MKKILSLTLAILMLLSLCACGGAPEEKEKPQLQIGYGKVNITPTYSVGMAASGDEKNRRNTGLVSYLFATCVAVEYDEEIYLLYTVDTISIGDTFGDTLRVEILNEFPDLKLENIYLGATHTHSAPATGWSDNSPEGRYRQEFIAYMPQAARLALQDLAPATMSACKFDLEGMNFVRHYIMNDGTYAGSNFGDTSSGYKEHTYDVNHEMILVNFEREGKEDVLLVNWAAHPANPYDAAIGNLNISADHPGWCRDELEKLTGAKVAYFNGASGDVVPNSQIKEINHGLNAKQYGQKLAQMAYEHYDELKPLEVDNVKTTQKIATVTVDHEFEHLIAQCMEISHVRFTLGDRTKGNKMATDIGLSSAYHASAIIARSKMGPTDVRALNAFRIGPVSFTTGTYEMASEHAEELKAQSPYEFTFQICGNKDYIPREEAIDYYSYEGTVRRYTRETGDQLVGEYVKMLNDLQ